jgi:hypothetical protein
LDFAPHELRLKELDQSQERRYPARWHLGQSSRVPEKRSQEVNVTQRIQAGIRDSERQEPTVTGALQFFKSTPKVSHMSGNSSACHDYSDGGRITHNHVGLLRYALGRLAT